MTRSKDIGTRWETTVVRHLRENGFRNAERRALSGSSDRGDILVAPGLIAECKDHARYSDQDVYDWIRETQREVQNANAECGLLIIKRRGLQGQPGNAWCWWRLAPGAPWMCQFLDDAIIELHIQGWGDPC